MHAIYMIFVDFSARLRLSGLSVPAVDQWFRINSMENWFVYMVRCSDNSLYTGIARDVEKRVAEHNSEKTGAKYTQSRRPVYLVYRETVADRSAASRRELAIKRLSKKQKEALISHFQDGFSWGPPFMQMMRRTS